MLVQDPDADFSAMTVNVAAGYFDDPATLPGLAHFLEHAVHLGSTKYPGSKSYKAFLAQHGGTSNASTGRSLVCQPLRFSRFAETPKSNAPVSNRLGFEPQTALSRLKTIKKRPKLTGFLCPCEVYIKTTRNICQKLLDRLVDLVTTT